MGERLNGIKEVVGSIPIISTIVIFKESVFAEFFSGTGFWFFIDFDGNDLVN